MVVQFKIIVVTPSKLSPMQQDFSQPLSIEPFSFLGQLKFPRDLRVPASQMREIWLQLFFGWKTGGHDIKDMTQDVENFGPCKTFLGCQISWKPILTNKEVIRLTKTEAISIFNFAWGISCPYQSQIHSILFED